MNDDQLSRIICESLNLRAYTVSTLGVVREITSIHGTTPNATAALGKTITAAALMSAMLKPDSDQSLLLKIEGSGPVREIHVQADARGNIRGYVANPQPDLTDPSEILSFSKTIGAGFLTVRKDIGMKEPYTSVIPLQTGEVAADTAYYLTVSEQVPSAVIIALTLDRDGAAASSGGILIQTFPDTPDHAVEMVEKNIAAMDHSLGEALRRGSDIHGFLKELFNNEPITVLESRSICASCRCDRKKIRSMIGSLNPEELRDMIDKDGGAEVSCTFCGKKYHFDGKELERILHGRDASSSSGKPGEAGHEIH